jgi:hypothetical protein
MSDDAPPPSPRRRGRAHPLALAHAVPALTRRALAERGFHAPRLAVDWAAIVGEDLARATLPEKLLQPERPDGGLLVLRVSPAAALEIQHREPQIVERVNAAFGFRAVGRLRLRQAPIPVSERRVHAAPTLSPAESAKLEARAAVVADDDLRAALVRLGTSLGARRACHEKAT